MSETANRLCETDDVFGLWSRDVQEAVNNVERVDRKVACIQRQLVLLLRRNGFASRAVDYCVDRLRSLDGRMSIRDLERQTAYSRRYLERLFQQHVGLSPKRLAEIFRFQRFYGKWAAGVSFDLLKAELYDHYYDQSHFSRQSHRMTGHPPQRFMRDVSNEFGRRILVQPPVSA